MLKQKQEVVIKGTTPVALNKYTEFDPANPSSTPIDRFVYLSPDSVKEGKLIEGWAKDGYILIGSSEITVRLMPNEEITSSAIASLKEQKKDIQAKAQMAINEIEGRIQNMLALPYTP